MIGQGHASIDELETNLRTLGPADVRLLLRQTSTSTPSSTRFVTHASRQSGGTASAFMTATLKPWRLKNSSMRPVMSHVPVWVA